MKENFKKVFRINPKNENVIIEVSLDDYIEFFHEWDNSVFKKRDIHPELVDFLDLCSLEIPFSQKLEVQFFITNEERKEAKEQLLRESYTNHYKALHFNETRNIKRVFSSSGVLLLVSFILLLLYAKLRSDAPTTMLSTVFLESLLIGGWVLTWEAFHGVTIDILEPLRRRRDLKRFLRADISFRYTEGL